MTLVIGLLVLVVILLGYIAYLLGEIAHNTAERKVTILGVKSPPRRPPIPA